MRSIELPQWAKEYGVKGNILVPRECVSPESEQTSWEKVDWWLAIFLLLEGWHERIWEKTHGVIHSYSFRLKGWDTRAWDHAWVNRIALFLRRWFCVAFKKGNDFLGQLPKAKYILSHDVDAVSKTCPIRLKQGAFNIFNALRFLICGSISKSIEKCGKSFRLLFGKEDWWVFEKMLEMEDEAGVKAIFHFYADKRPKNFKRWLMDPGYDISSQRIKKLFGRLKAEGHEIGLHPTFDSWRSPDLLSKQKKMLEENAKIKIRKCRQHWLRFSWKNTWESQLKAGIECDSTLMFNDRSGFRNSTAGSWNPWNEKKGEAYKLKCTASVLMDSHLYDYDNIGCLERNGLIEEWINECCLVNGECSLLWHPHTLTKDYEWEDGFKYLLQKISKN